MAFGRKTQRGRSASDVLSSPLIGDIVRGRDLGQDTKERYEFMRCITCGQTRWVSHYSNPQKRWPNGRMCKSCANRKRSLDRVASGHIVSAETRRKIAGARRSKIDESRLLSLYLGDRLSCLVISRLLGCSQSAVARRLRYLGIPVRTNIAEYLRSALCGRLRSVEDKDSMRKGWKRVFESDAGEMLRRRLSSRNKAYWDRLPSQEKEERRNQLRRVISEWRDAGGAVDHSLEKNTNWQGGKSFEPYSPEFNEVFKEQIRERDSRVCQVCGCPENGRHHDVHHIDFDKKHSCSGNLITLCHICHTRTFGRVSESNISEDFKGMLYWILSVRGIRDNCLTGAE